MSLFEVPTIQMSIFMLSKSAGVLFFSLLLSLKFLLQPLEMIFIQMCQVL